MTLTIAQLEEAIIALRYAADGGVFTTGDRLFVEALAPIVAELHRRKHGPYSLSEAIASGRPFRRKNPNTNGKWITASYLDTYDYADVSSYNDYIAVDYELYPEVGEG